VIVEQQPTQDVAALAFVFVAEAPQLFGQVI